MREVIVAYEIAELRSQLTLSYRCINKKSPQEKPRGLKNILIPEFKILASLLRHYTHRLINGDRSVRLVKDAFTIFNNQHLR